MQQIKRRNFVKSTVENGTPNKDIVRKNTADLICEHFITKKKTAISFLTLPSAFWIFEKYVSKRLKQLSTTIRPYTKFVGCEMDWDTYSAGALEIPMKQGYSFKQTRNEEINCQIMSNGYSHLFFSCDIFDYIKLVKDHEVEDDRKMDCIWLDTMSTICTIEDKLPYLANVMKDDAIVILTVVRGREKTKLPMERVSYINSIMLPLGLVLIEKFEYKDSTAMLQLVYKRMQID